MYKVFNSMTNTCQVLFKGIWHRFCRSFSNIACLRFSHDRISLPFPCLECCFKLFHFICPLRSHLTAAKAIEFYTVTRWCCLALSNKVQVKSAVETYSKAFSCNVHSSGLWAWSRLKMLVPFSRAIRIFIGKCCVSTSDCPRVSTIFSDCEQYLFQIIWFSPLLQLHHRAKLRYPFLLIELLNVLLITAEWLFYQLKIIFLVFLGCKNCSCITSSIFCRFHRQYQLENQNRSQCAQQRTHHPLRSDDWLIFIANSSQKAPAWPTSNIS